MKASKDRIGLYSVQNVIAETLGLRPDQVSDELHYQAIPQWDSLAHVSLMLAIEETYGLKIDEDTIVDLETVASIKHFVEFGEVLGRQASRPEPGAAAKVQRGLRGVVFDRTTISRVDGQGGELLHRGYAVDDLVEHVTFEHMVHLLLYGELPSPSQLTRLTRRLCELRPLSHETLRFVEQLSQLPPMVVLQAVTACLGQGGLDTQDEGLNIVAKVPTIIAAHHAFRRGQRPRCPREDLGHAANLLHMLNLGDFDEEDARLLDGDFVVHADHDANASAFCARIVASTEGNLYAAIAAAMAAFDGPLHGGALSGASQMLDTMGSTEAVPKVLQDRLDHGLPIYGFGHRIYKTCDPRAKFLKSMAERLGRKTGEDEILCRLEAIVEFMRPYMAHGLNINVDFYACVAYRLLKVPDDMTVSLFAASRTAGWVAQFIEQKENNILIRPQTSYVGFQRRRVPASHCGTHHDSEQAKAC